MKQLHRGSSALCALLALSCTPLAALMATSESGAATRGRGTSLPIYLEPELRAEAERPAVELAPSGGGFWKPGPERFYGWALRDLRDYLQRVTGAEHPLTSRDARARSGIFAGTFAQFPNFKSHQAGWPKVAASPDPEAFVIEAQGDRLYILGKSPSGLIAAIYTMLDRLGCKWFAPGKEWESVPASRRRALDPTLNTASAGPSYQTRHFFPSYGPNTSAARPDERRREYTLWNLRNRMGGTAYTANAHNTEILPPSLFQTRPELFALVGGKRHAQEIARSNPETISLAVEGAVTYLKTHEGKGSFYNSFSVETGDGVPPDEESLGKIGNHTPTDLNYWFANQVAAGIEKAGLKDKWVGMYSYSDHAGVPSFDLHPKVGVLVTTGLDFSSGLTVEQRLDGLRLRRAQRLGIYEYLNLITWSLDKPGSMPAAAPLRVAANLRRWHDYGARSYIAETSDSWINGGASHYLASRLLWDTQVDPEKELDTYYQGAFGPAAKEIRALQEDWSRIIGKGVLPPMARGRMAQWHHWITAAEQRVAGNPVYQARLSDIKRYYLYLNLWREFELDLRDPNLPSKEERFRRILRNVGSNRGRGAFHALGLLPTLLWAAPQSGFSIEKWGDEFRALSKNITDEAAWKAFPPLSDAQVDEQFAAVRLPLDNVPATGPTFDPRLKRLPATARPPAEIRFPRLHGPPIPTGPRQYVLQVVAPIPKLTVQIVGGSPLGGGVDDRSCTALDANWVPIKRFEFKINQPVSFELSNLKPGVYTLYFPEFGAEQVTVLGGSTFGAVRAFDDAWGFNPMRRVEQKDSEEVVSYFVVPPGWEALKVRLSDGAVIVGFTDGAVIAAEVKGSEKKAAEEFRFPPSDKPRSAYVKWSPKFLTSMGLVVEGVTLYSPDPGSVFYESLD